MQRRDFSRHLLSTGVLTLGAPALLVPAMAHASIGGFKEGSDYVKLGRPAPVDAPAGQVEVLEFFAYSCIHCYNFEPVFEDWKKKLPAGVTTRRVPVAFSEAFVPMQRLYYALEAMDQVESMHGKVFRAIHVDKQRLMTEKAIMAWMDKQDIDRKRFADLFNSFSVTGKARRAVQLQDAYQIEGTPALGVGGRFTVAGQGPRTVKVAEALIADIRKG